MKLIPIRFNQSKDARLIVKKEYNGWKFKPGRMASLQESKVLNRINRPFATKAEAVKMANHYLVQAGFKQVPGNLAVKNHYYLEGYDVYLKHHRSGYWYVSGSLYVTGPHAHMEDDVHQQFFETFLYDGLTFTTRTESKAAVEEFLDYYQIAANPKLTQNLYQETLSIEEIAEVSCP